MQDTMFSQGYPKLGNSKQVTELSMNLEIHMGRLFIVRNKMPWNNSTNAM